MPYPSLLLLLWAVYGAAAHRTVPSAGGLYPLDIYYINLRATGELAPGVYQLSYATPAQVGFEPIDADLASAPRAFIEADALVEAQGVVAICGSFARTALKYRTRAALYVPLEAGHAAQNLLLAAAEAGVAAVEVGGFFEAELASVLRLSPGSLPLTSVILGSAPSATDLAQAADAPEIDFRWMETDKLPYVPPFFVCSARVKAEDSGWSWGRSTDPATAQVKASAEAQERWSCTKPSGLREARFGDLEHGVDPRQILAYAAAQYLSPDFPYEPFDTGASHLWKEGEDVLSGERRVVLADFLYFGDFLDRQHPYTNANSSGAAAYPSLQGALERAVLELIERDAFMRTWLGRVVRPTIDSTTLPATSAARIRALQQAGVEIVLKDHSLGLAPVVFAFAQSRTAGFTLTAAGAAFDVEEALDSALMELELGVATRLAAGVTAPIQPGEVKAPLDHMNLYARRAYYRRADFLGHAGETVVLSDVGRAGAGRWNELAALLHARGQSVLWFDLAPPGASLRQGRVPLYIGRAIVPGLIPISFGYGQEPLASFSARSPADWRRRRFDAPTTAPCIFPHPFG